MLFYFEQEQDQEHEQDEAENFCATFDQHFS